MTASTKASAKEFVELTLHGHLDGRPVLSVFRRKS
jgi:hypothetical protein